VIQTKIRDNPGWLIFLISMLVFSTTLSDREFIQFQARFALFAKEMWHYGISLFPTTRGLPYPDYPATHTIIIYFLSRVFGRMSDYIIVLPTLIASSLTLVFTYKIAAERSEKWGILAVLILLLTHEFFASSRILALDPLIMCVTTATFYVLYTEQSPRAVLLSLCFIAGFSLRGPLGFVIPAGVATSYFLVEKEYKTLRLFVFLSGLLFASLIGFIYTATHLLYGDAFANNMLEMQFFGRLQSLGEYPFYYYLQRLPVSYALSVPFTLFTAFAYLRAAPSDSKDRRLLQHLFMWIVIILIGLSIPTEKKMRYLLPIAPAFAIAGAYFFYDESGKKWIQYLRSTAIKLLRLLPYVCLTLVISGFFITLPQSLDIKESLYLSLFALTVLAIYDITTTRFWRTSLPIISIFSFAAFSFIIVYISIAEPINLALSTSRPFAAEVESVRPTSTVLVFYQIGPDAEDIKKTLIAYLQH